MPFEDAQDAAFHGFVPQLKASIAGGVHVNEPFETRFSNSCSTLLHIAAQQGHTECLEVLLDTGADACLLDCWGHTAAHLAALEGYPRALEIIVQKDARVLLCVDEAERTPLHVAAQTGDVACIDVLLKCGAELQPMTIESDGSQVPMASPLHLASAAGHVDALRALLTACNQSMLSSVDSFGRTPLHLAARNGHTDCVKVLVQGGSDVNAMNCWGATPLHLAAQNKHYEAVELLLASGAFPSVRDNHGMTALHYASQAQSVPCIKLLLDCKADVNSRSLCRETPLTLALVTTASRDFKAASILLAAGASLDCLQDHYHEVSDVAKETVRAHVQNTSEAASSSMHEFMVLQCKAGRLSMSLCNDVVHIILANVFDVKDDFLRILLGGEGEGPCSLL